MSKESQIWPDMDVDDFLANCVFYPCSEMHGFPIKVLSNRFNRFFYVDYHVGTKQLNDRISSPGLKGYEAIERTPLSPEVLFGMSWDSITQLCRARLPEEASKWHHPYVNLIRFKRDRQLGRDHGPPNIELLFARCEAFSAFQLAFSRRDIAPGCLVSICPGISFGKNYDTYPQLLNHALRGNGAGLPELLLYDRASSDPENGAFLEIVLEYRSHEVFNVPRHGTLTLGALDH